MTVENTEYVLAWPVALLTYISLTSIVVLGHIRDFVGSVTGRSRYCDKTHKAGYGALFNSWDSFFTRRMYHRIQDCWNRPLASAPGSHVKVMERDSDNGNCTLHTTGKLIDAINVGSYNYLGFADDWKTSCKEAVLQAVDAFPLSNCSSRLDIGSTSLHTDLEASVAKYVGKEAALVFAMGYDTNASVLPALMGKGDLIISDCLNHTSIVNGARAANTQVRVFQHNTPSALEALLIECITYGQPRMRRPWGKILVIVEGIYSMEGDICRLKEIVAICKKYKAYLYVDEAHSIGALGKTGRGVCEHSGVDPKDIDILMGTFTKSFSGMGGYIASSPAIINAIRAHASGYTFHNSLSPIVCAQVSRALAIISGDDGSDLGRCKLNSLKENANFFRKEMHRLGVHVLGDEDSPIVPILFYTIFKIATFSRMCLERGVAVVVVGFPATNLLLGRARVCISAGHTREDLVKTVAVFEELADTLNFRYSKRLLG